MKARSNGGAKTLTDAEATRMIARLTLRLESAGRGELAADLVKAAQIHLTRKA